MATRTITLEMDAYEKRRFAKRAGESFSAVVLHAVLKDEPLTGERLRNHLKKGGSGVSHKDLDAVEKTSQHDPTPDDPWR
jgi:hypothetical protein